MLQTPEPLSKPYRTYPERLDGEEKTQVIDYYSKNMQQLGVFNNTFPSR